MSIDTNRLRPLDLVVIGRRKWTLWPPTPSNLQAYSISRSIQEFTDSDVNHVAVIVRVGPTPKTTLVVEAHYPAVRCVTLEEAVRSRDRAYFIRHPQMTPERGDIGAKWLHAQVGEPYDVGLIVMMVAALKQGGLTALHKLRVTLVQEYGYDDEDTPWICSELAVAAIHQTGLQAYPGYDATAPVQDVMVPTPDEVLDSGLYLLVDHIP